MQSLVRLSSSRAWLAPGEACIPEVARETFWFFFFNLDPTVEILSMRKENKSCGLVRASCEFLPNSSDVGCLKLALVVIFAPWKAAHSTNKGFVCLLGESWLLSI